ncbi:hypothetical protein PFLUV_G00083400 [Perca fluviatilis]|uniref:Uncharacterized protein n=1 Tax=Perca fluviatilis TaxID=8168 RepID=A0A6A5F3E3_PERFL|nr:hypothetical protein PFLUV_G00083400 [Perca fluviatilis]
MAASKLSNVVAFTLGTTMRLGSYRGMRAALSGVTALPLLQCAVIQPLAPRERAAPLTIPGAVQGKIRCENGVNCGVQSQPLQTQYWVLGGAHF